MNDKHTRLKKSLIAHAIKGAVIIVGCAIGLGAAAYFDQNSQDNIKKLTSRERALKSQITQLKARQTRAGNSLELYRKLVKDSNLKSLELNRKNISELLKALSVKYKINNLSINVNPIQAQMKAPFIKKTGTVITTTIDLQFDSSSDAHGFAFTDEVLKSFSGYLNLKSFSAKRDKNLSENVIRELLKGGRTNFIRSQVSFDWLGLRPKAEVKKEGAK